MHTENIRIKVNISKELHEIYKKAAKEKKQCLKPFIEEMILSDFSSQARIKKLMQTPK